MFKSRRETEFKPAGQASRPISDNGPEANPIVVAQPRTEAEYPRPEPEPPAKKRDEGIGVVLIGKMTVIRGEIGDCKSIEIQGHVEGSVIAEEVVVRDGGTVNGNLTAIRAEIHGHVEGNVHVNDLLDVRSTGRVYGEFSYGRIAIASGGHISGSIQRQEIERDGPEFAVEATGGSAPHHNPRQSLNDFDAFAQPDRWERLVAAE